MRPKHPDRQLGYMPKVGNAVYGVRHAVGWMILHYDIVFLIKHFLLQDVAYSRFACPSSEADDRGQLPQIGI
jgi:hypothetical protein